MTLQDKWNELNEEQRERARQLTSPEELLEFAHEIGADLTDEDLEAVAGGSGWDDFYQPCPDQMNCKPLGYS